MALEMHATVRIDTDLTDDLPDNEYRVTMQNYREQHEPLVAYEKGITGKLLVHRAMNGTTPETDHHYRIRLLMSRAEKDLLLADNGKKVYFMPHYRDESDPTSYRTLKLLIISGEVEMLDPQQDWWTADIMLIDATDLTVDS